MPAKESADDAAVWDDTTPIADPIYRIDERPSSLAETLLYAWQHTLVDVSPFITPLVVAAALGMGAAEEAAFINSCLFAMGIATLIQTTVGNRLPIVQGPSATLIGTMAPVAREIGGPAMWGAAFLGGLIEGVFGATGLLRFLRRLFPPVVAGVVIVAIGLSLGNLAVRLAVGDGSGINFAFAGACLLCVLLLRFGLPDAFSGILGRGAILFAIVLVGLGGGSLTGQVDWALVSSKPWFALPRLFPYGGPGFGWELLGPATLIVLAGYLGSMVESLGDYAATCAVAGETYRVRHMNRGIFAEGIGSAIATAFGGLPCTSFTQNIGIIATTRVASRFVVQVAAVILMLYGLSPKLGALLVALPRSVLGGVFLLICGMILVSGVRLLGPALRSTPDAFLVGITLVVATALPPWARQLGDDWLERVPLFLRLTITNGVVLSVFVGITLHLVLGAFPGARRERAQAAGSGTGSSS